MKPSPRLLPALFGIFLVSLAPDEAASATFTQDQSGFYLGKGRVVAVVEGVRQPTFRGSSRVRIRRNGLAVDGQSLNPKPDGRMSFSFVKDGVSMVCTGTHTTVGRRMRAQGTLSVQNSEMFALDQAINGTWYFHLIADGRRARFLLGFTFIDPRDESLTLATIEVTGDAEKRR